MAESGLFGVDYAENVIGHAEEILVEHGPLQLSDSFLTVVDFDQHISQFCVFQHFDQLRVFLQFLKPRIGNSHLLILDKVRLNDLRILWQEIDLAIDRSA